MPRAKDSIQVNGLPLMGSQLQNRDLIQHRWPRQRVVQMILVINPKDLALLEDHVVLQRADQMTLDQLIQLQTVDPKRQILLQTSSHYWMMMEIWTLSNRCHVLNHSIVKDVLLKVCKIFSD